MDPYILFLALGGAGLGAMAMSGFTHHGPGHAGHSGHGHAGNAGQGSTAHGHGGQGAAHAHHAGTSLREGIANSLMTLMSPRVLFSVCLGLGTAGLVLRPVLGGPLLFAAALAAGVVFERILVTPIWNFAFRFESRPALTLESATGSEATAVSSFDANGQGLISIEVDGQIVQLLGTLRASDREFRPKIPSGTKLRVEDVDADRNRCTVSLI
jgi:hypothetical protein